MAPRYRVTLESNERKDLVSLTRIAKTSAKLFRNARALLLCDKGPEGPAWTVGKTAEALGVSAARSSISSGASSKRGWRRRCGASRDRASRGP